MSWLTPDSDVGRPNTGYIVTTYVGYYPLQTTTFNSTNTTQTATGLTNGKTYKFRVQAANAIGTGPHSKVTNPVTPSS